MERIQKVQKIYALKGISIFRGFALPMFLSICLISCASTYRKVKPDVEKVDLEPVQTDIPESELLDVRIQIFDPGKLPSSEDASRGLSEEIRTAESYYMAVQLKNAMQQTGCWGAVRVVPAKSSGDEVLVTGRILKSDGEELKIKIGASDAMGNQWFRKKTFKGAVSTKMYEESSENQIEVFQNVYNRIANELATYRQTMTSEQVHEIRQVAEIKFAEELVPSAFRNYLKKGEKKGLIKVDRLPSEDDEMLKRVRRVRERDYMLIDTLDAQFEGLHKDMEGVYTDWRKTRLEEMNMIREIDAKKNAETKKGIGLLVLGALAGAVAGQSQGYNPALSAGVGAAVGYGVSTLFNADRITEEAEINKAALEELGISFTADVKPTVLEVKGETIKLTGSAEAKYQQWREVLAKLYAVETGTAIDPAESIPNAQENKKPNSSN